MALRKTTPAQIVIVVCLAQALAMLGVFFWPALVLEMAQLWGLSRSECGWITAMFYAGYMLAVPVLAPLTDRMDARRVYLIGAGCALAGHLILAILADGFWGALLGRFLAGVGGAGTQMVGLKLMVDRLPPDAAPRAVACQATSILLSTAFSFLCADVSARLFGLPLSFAVPAVAALLAGALIVSGTAPRSPGANNDRKRYSFVPVLRDHRVMAYIVAYGLHSFAFNALRGWCVPLLAYILASQSATAALLTPAWIATAFGLLAAASSYLGNELALRIGQRRLAGAAMLGASAVGTALAACANIDYLVVLSLLAVFCAMVSLDLSVLTATVTKLAAPARQGATLAVHSFVGYAGSFAGPITVGLAMDYFSDAPASAWATAFLILAAADLAGLVVLVVWAAEPTPEPAAHIQS
jgi:predicted MFS family arabinose efflux permease